MKKLFIVSLLSLTSACAPSTSNFVHPETSVYVSEFLQKNKTPVPALIVNFGNAEGSAAICKQWSNGQSEVIIDANWWGVYCDSQRRGIIFHELGHCIKNREHVEFELSYMYPEVQSCPFYEINQDELDSEMFP